MSIRRCEKKDLDKVMEIEENSFDYPYSREVFEDHLSSDLFLVIENEKGKIVGYILAEDQTDYGMIISIAVSPSHREKGFGRSLLEGVQNKIDADDYLLTVRVSNQEALEFYDKVGFSNVGKIEGYYQNDEKALLMHKEE